MIYTHVSVISQMLSVAQLNFWLDLGNIQSVMQLMIHLIPKLEFSQSQMAIRAIQLTFYEPLSDD